MLTSEKSRTQKILLKFHLTITKNLNTSEILFK
jgi:hypothetical protein